MKTKVLLTTVLTIFLSAGIYAQNSYQTFLANGFKVKSGCEFDVKYVALINSIRFTYFKFISEVA